ncbi:MAG TPA: dihydrofolate reductase family protein [Candidatus Saccharimonadales bacterium]|nr:dihydrofolate reductase family protein [Candidatus Saccharimonadales bacterium]
MKTFIIAALTADGYIGQDAGHLSTRWTSHADKVFFTQKTKEAGAALFGRTTFETFNRALPGRRTIVYTTRPESITTEGVETIKGSPAEVVAALQAQGVEHLAICGGAHVYAEFLAAGLVDEIFITIHPVVFGAGVPLFREPLEKQLKLLDVQNIGDDTVMLHYSVS